MISLNTIGVSHTNNASVNNCRPGGRCKILGVLMTYCGTLRTDLKILGVLNITFYPILRNIGGAIASPAPPVPTILWSIIVWHFSFLLVHACINAGQKSHTSSDFILPILTGWKILNKLWFQTSLPTPLRGKQAFYSKIIIWALDAPFTKESLQFEKCFLSSKNCPEKATWAEYYCTDRQDFTRLD